MLQNSSGDFQINRTTEEREESALLGAHEVVPGEPSGGPGDRGVTVQPDTLDSAMILRTRTSPPAEGQNASPVPRGRGMSKQDLHRWGVSGRVLCEGH